MPVHLLFGKHNALSLIFSSFSFKKKEGEWTHTSIDWFSAGPVRMPASIISLVRFRTCFSFVVTSLVAKDSADPKQSTWLCSDSLDVLNRSVISSNIAMTVESLSSLLSVNACVTSWNLDRENSLQSIAVSRMDEMIIWMWIAGALGVVMWTLTSFARLLSKPVSFF